MSQDEFTYNTVVRKSYYFVVAALLLSSFIILKLNYINIVEKGLYLGFFTTILALSVPLSIFLRMYLFVRPRIFSTYVLCEGKILQKFKNKTKEIEFDKIEKLSLTWLPPHLLGGFIIQLKTGQKFIFLSLLGNNHIVFNQIIEQYPQLMPAAKSTKYLTLAKRVNTSWNTSIARFKIWPLTVVKFLIFPTVASFYLHTRPMQLSDDLTLFENYILILLLVYFVQSIVQVCVGALEEVYYLREVAGVSEKTLFIASQTIYFFILFAIFYLVY